MALRIDTKVEKAKVFIDGKEYILCDNTAGLQDELFRIEQEAAGKPAYRMWLEELKLLLGEDAVSALFPSGENENIDRMASIFMGVARAFDGHKKALERAERERVASEMQKQTAPLAELMRVLKKDK